jgi:uncharacterized protein YndB with AHSA1/START domain
MTSLRHTITVPADPAAVWAAIADVGAIHERLAAGFVTATELEGNHRVVTFANGVVAHESIISIDDDRRRMAYSITESPAGMTYHHGSFEVVDATVATGGSGAVPFCEVVWTVDLLPAQAAPLIDEVMAGGCVAMAATLARLAPPVGSVAASR